MTPSDIWSIAEILRGDWRAAEYGEVILPLTVLRRLDCVLAPVKAQMLQVKVDADAKGRAASLYLKRIDPNIRFWNVSKYDLKRVLGDPANIRANLADYLDGFDAQTRDIFTSFELDTTLDKLEKQGILYQVIEEIAKHDLHPSVISNAQMGDIFEGLVHRFAEAANAGAGEFYTPREVVRLCALLGIADDFELKSGRPVVRSVYDSNCGTAGMLNTAEDEIHAVNSTADVSLYGQELNPFSSAIARADLLVKGHDPSQIVTGNTLSDDGHPHEKFDLMVANPPYGVDWKKVRPQIEQEHTRLGFKGRFGPGLPRVSDGSFLFLMHLISKMRSPVEGGSRISIVLSGSPLFTGGAGSGESEIRRWLFENDLVDAIVALPTQIFYNTGIQTYVWVLSNRKPESRKGLVRLVDASHERFWQPMRKSMGDKRRELSSEGIAEIIRMVGDDAVEDSDVLKVMKHTEFATREIRVERPLRLRFEINGEAVTRLRDQAAIRKLDRTTADALCSAILTHMDGQVWMDRRSFLKALDRAIATADLKIGAPVKKTILAALGERDEAAEICRGKDDQPEPDTDLRDHELVPTHQDWKEYVAHEIKPFLPDAWIDENYCDPTDGAVGRVGYEINFNQHFHSPKEVRTLEDVSRDLRNLEFEIASLLKEVV